MKIVLSGALALSLIFLNASPALAQLGGVTPPAETPAPTPPAPEPVVAPVVQVVTPPADTAGPVISGLASLSLLPTEATLAWATDELAVSRLEYGTTQSYGSEATLSATALLAHTAIILSLTPGTTYYYCIHATDLAGNASSLCSQFATATVAEQPATPVGDTPPDITLVTESGITSSSATVNFTTSEIANAQVEYGLTAGYGSHSTFDPNLGLTHSVTLSGLTPNTTYHYRIKTSDQVGNETIGADETLNTIPIGAAPITTPVVVDPATFGHSVAIVEPANISNVTSASVSSSGAIVSWTTDKLATTQVEYGTDTSYALHTILGSTLATTHTASLTNLASGTAYHFRVRSDDADENITYSLDYTFTTSGTAQGNNAQTPPIILPPVIDSSEPSAEPEVVQAVPEDTQIELSWENPVGEDYGETVIIVNEDHYPTSPTDGTPVYVGTGDTFTDTGEVNGYTNYYAIYSVTKSGSYSEPVRIAIAPQAGVKEFKINRSGVLETASVADHFTKIYKKGAKDAEVGHLQEILAKEAGFKQSDITGYFGALTEASLKKFQARYGLAQTGVVDTPTQAKLNSLAKSEEHLDVPESYVLFASDLKQGARSAAVGALQRYLVYEGSLAPDSVTGYFGTQTKAAVAKFQKKYGIVPPAGYVGEKTRHKMRQLAGL